MVPIRKNTYVPPYFYPILLVLVTATFFVLIAVFYKAITWRSYPPCCRHRCMNTCSVAIH